MQSSETLSIDGSYGEGGGQMLRSALSLSLLLEKSFEMRNIRAGRQKKGLQRQHLTAVKACQTVCNARADGAELDSTNLHFVPNKIEFGKISFDTGTAASTTLILQALLPALSFAGGKSEVELVGGTSNPMAPSSLYLQNIFLPTIAKMGVKESLEVEKYGWYPKGGGIIKSEIHPSKWLKSINFEDKGKLISLTGFALGSNLPKHVIEREKKQLLKHILGLDPQLQSMTKINLIEGTSVGPGTELFLYAEYEHSIAGFSSLGEIGKPAEKLADEVFDMFNKFNNSESAIENHLADQLIIYMSLAKGTSKFTTSRISNHLLTNIWLIKQFLPEVNIIVEGERDKNGRVVIEGIGFENKYLGGSHE